MAFDKWINQVINGERSPTILVPSPKEMALREQIAKKIEFCHEIRMAFENLSKCKLGECSHAEDAAIARGQDDSR